MDNPFDAISNLVSEGEGLISNNPITDALAEGHAMKYEAETAIDQVKEFMPAAPETPEVPTEPTDEPTDTPQV